MYTMKKHLIVGLILIVALIAAASAETGIVGDYNVSFKLDKPHETTIETAESFNSTGSDPVIAARFKPTDPVSIQIKTFDGRIWISMVSFTVSTYNNLALGDLTLSGNKTGHIWLTGLTMTPMQPIYKLLFDHDDIYVQSTMPFMDTADFFKSLRIEKIKKI
jgi:hypothetical protein